MTEVVIEVSNVSKAYPIYRNPADILRELVTGKKRHDEFWALKDVSFSLMEKQRLGIIGANGSGKSTLLKILSGHLLPTTGNVQVNGKVSAMLSLSTVLNPEETGLSNIRFNLILNGCPKSKINQIVDEVIDFSELGAFIYSPVKTYSSGMNAKLAFAINTAIEPEILIIDEVLSVGDSYFVGKATQRMKELCDRGKALVFVSHSDAAVRMLCDSVLWMENGSVRMHGPADYVLARYEEDYRRVEDEVTRTKNRERQQKKGVTLGSSDVDPEGERIRIVAANDKRRFEDSHYVRKLSLDYCGKVKDIPLVGHDMENFSGSGGRIDLFGSQWGRVFGFENTECRILGSMTGRSNGGHILVDSGQEGDEVRIIVEARASQGKELLRLEHADIAQSQWVPLNDLTSQNLADGWIRYSGLVKLKEATSAERSRAQNFIAEQSKPPVEILDVRLAIESGDTHILNEREPFEIIVRAKAKESVPLCDIGIKIMREDGVYCFWQSSGMNGGNLENIYGTTEIAFQFKSNPFSAGEYAITCYTADGWQYPENYPYTEVFDRKVAALSFRVLPELPDVDMGCVNVRATVVARTI